LVDVLELQGLGTTYLPVFWAIPNAKFLNGTTSQCCICHKPEKHITTSISVTQLPDRIMPCELWKVRSSWTPCPASPQFFSCDIDPCQARSHIQFHHLPIVIVSSFDIARNYHPRKSLDRHWDFEATSTLAEEFVCHYIAMLIRNPPATGQRGHYHSGK